MSDNDTPTPILEDHREPCPEFDPKTISDRYVVVDKLGEGGMGKVYLAFDPLIDRHVAIKVLRFEDGAGQLLKRLQQEARAAAKLDHPGIVRALDFGLIDGRDPYLVMEYIQGESFDKVLKETQPLQLDEFQVIFSQIMSAMSHAHDKGIVHRDLKPSNILIQKDLGQIQAFVLDFGIAKILQDSMSQVRTGTGQLVGSPRYSSPEQISGTSVDARSDIYSLGCVMYEALTGSVPFRGINALETLQMHLNETAPTLSEGSGDSISYSEQLETMIARCLAKNPSDRFDSMAELLNTLEDLNHIPIEVENSEDIASEESSRSVFYIVAGVGALLSLIVGSLAANNSPSPSVRLEGIPGRFEAPSNLMPDISSQSDFDRSALPKGLSPAISDLIDGGQPGARKTLQLLLTTKNVNPGVKRLTLSGTQVTDENLKRLSYFPNLDNLVLNNTKISGEGVRNVVDNARQISILSLNYVRLSDSDLTEIKKIRSLKSLSLAGIKSISDKGISLLAELPNLQSLDLRYTSFSLSGLKKFKGHSGLTIDVCGCRAFQSENIPVLEIEYGVSLKSDKSMPGTSNGNVVTASLLAEPDSGQGVIIDKLKSGELVSQASSKFGKDDYLKTLQVFQPQSFEQNQDIALLRDGPEEKLLARTELVLAYGILNRHDWERLSKCVELKKLDLSHTNTTNKDLLYLSSLKNIEHITLTGTKTTPSGIREAFGQGKISVFKKP